MYVSDNYNKSKAKINNDLFWTNVFNLIWNESSILWHEFGGVVALDCVQII